MRHFTKWYIVYAVIASLMMYCILRINSYMILSKNIGEVDSLKQRIETLEVNVLQLQKEKK